MIRNSFPGRCACKVYVPAGQGYVNRRRITCGDCAAITRDPGHMFETEDEPDDYAGPGRYGFEE